MKNYLSIIKKQPVCAYALKINGRLSKKHIYANKSRAEWEKRYSDTPTPNKIVKILVFERK